MSLLSLTRRTLLGLVAATLLPAGFALADEVKLTFVLANDTYEMGPERDGRGGFPKMAKVFADERAANPNTIVVHAGDLLSPSLLSGIDQGEHMIVLSNMAKYDYFVPGNHEYDFGADVAKTRMGESEFPWLAANVTDADGNAIEGMEPSAIKEIAGVKVGFIGLALENTAELSSPGDLKFSPAIEAAKTEAEKLRGEGAEFLVAINHNTREVGQTLVDEGTVDLVLNGHNHDLWAFYNGRSAAMEAGHDGMWIGAIDIMLDISEKDGKRKIAWSPDFRFIDTQDVEGDATVQARVEDYEKVLDEELGVELGSTGIELDSRRASVRSQETAMGDIIADAMRKAVGADIAITNGGGIRGDKTYEAGSKLTRRDVLTELPFGNKTVLLEMTGAQVKEALENGVSQIEDGAGRFPQVSGVTFSVDKSAAAGSRVSDVMVDGKPLDEGKSYKVATNDYMANGGDGYAVMKDGKVLIDASGAKLMANDVMVYIRGMGEVKAPEGSRITIN